MKKIIVINQARMTSTRLPGKVLKTLHDGKALLQLQIERLRQSKLIDDIVIATTTNSQDDLIEGVATQLGVRFFRGSELNVLERYYLASKQNPSEFVIRITSDCPFIDPGIIDESIGQYLTSGADYGSNSEAYPNGMNVEIFRASMIDEAYLNSEKEYEREHVTPYFYTHPEKYRLMQVKSKTIYPRYRLTVDTPEDLKLIQAIYRKVFEKGNMFNLDDICDVMKTDPSLESINSHIVQKKFNE